MNPKNVILSPVEPGVTEYIQASQGENNARVFSFTVLDSLGQPLDMAGCTVAFYVDRLAKGVVQVTASVSGSVATVTLPSGACNVPGEWGCWLQIIKPNEYDLRVDNLKLRVQPCSIDDAAEASDDFSLLTQLIVSAQEAIDNANSAAGSANTAANEANTAAGAANTAAGSANSAAQSANSSAELAGQKAGEADNAAAAANTAASSATTAAQQAGKQRACLFLYCIRLAWTAFGYGGMYCSFLRRPSCKRRGTSDCLCFRQRRHRHPSLRRLQRSRRMGMLAANYQTQ